MNYRIREANFSDLDAIHNVECKSFSDPWSKSSFKIALNNPMSKIIVVEDTEIIAFMIISKLFEVSLDNIAVLPEYRNRHIGSMLLSELIKESDRMEITLEVEHSNINALELYKKFGFIIEGKREDYYGKGRHAYIMWNRGEKNERTWN